MDEKITREELEKWSDYNLVSWAVKHGWFYWHSNDQLRDPHGSFTTANNWENIGEWRRKMIIDQIMEKGL